MGFLESFISAPSYHYRGEPGLAFAWGAQPVSDVAAEPAQPFLVARQSGASPRGEPVFGRPCRSGDGNLALSEDGYLINSEGAFVLGLMLDAEGRRISGVPEVLRIEAEGIAPAPTDCLIYRANLPSFPLTAHADFEQGDSELLDRTHFARDPSAQGSGIVVGDDRVKFLARSLAGGSLTAFSREGAPLQLVLRWAKLGSLRTAGRDCWNLFYRVRRDPRGGEVAWKNSGHSFQFEADGRIDTSANAVPIFDVTVDGHRLGNLSFIFGAGGLTQFADRTGLVKVLDVRANGTAGGAFSGISMSTAGRLFAHFGDGSSRPIADVHLPEDANWEDSFEPARRVA